MRDLVEWLRSVGVEEITIRLDKSFFSKDIVKTFKHLESMPEAVTAMLGCEG